MAFMHGGPKGRAEHGQRAPDPIMRSSQGYFADICGCYGSAPREITEEVLKQKQ
jgi:hypothetical protein